MASWRLELGRVGPHQLAIEPLSRELVLGFDPPIGGPGLPLTRIAVVQPGSCLEVPPWLAPTRSLILPWPVAPLDDLWLLLCTADRRYWFEVPYGVCRLPGKHVEAPQLGPPRAPSGVGSQDVVFRWQTVRYEFGHASGWRLAVLVRSERPGELELVARRAEPGIPPPIALTASVDLRTLAIEQHESWGVEPASLHSARYRFLPQPPGPRAYVRLSATNGAPTSHLHLPTSLTDRRHRSSRSPGTPTS